MDIASRVRNESQILSINAARLGQADTKSARKAYRELEDEM